MRLLGVVGGKRLHACGDGGDRRLLEAGLAHPETMASSRWSLANAAHIKNVPGRKTDANDAAWIADLLAHGLIRASFVPDISQPKASCRLRPICA